MNPIKFWQVIKDDARRTFEVVSQERNTNAFENKTYAMQRSGMNVSCFIPPVSGKHSNKDALKITNYTKEDGLYERLLAEYRQRTMEAADEIGELE